MDSEDLLQKDMVKQLLKYVPTAAEREALENNVGETFARADRFLLEISK